MLLLFKLLQLKFKQWFKIPDTKLKNKNKLLFWMIWLFNYDYNNNIDSVIYKVCMDDIIDVYTDTFEITITTKSGYKLITWNENKYYAWLMTGKFESDTVIYDWNKCRPSRKYMGILKTAIDDFQKNKILTL